MHWMPPWWTCALSDLWMKPCWQSWPPVCQTLVTLEEPLIGGAGSAVNEALQRLRVYKPVLNLGLPDRFIEQGSQAEILQLLGLDAAGSRPASDNLSRPDLVTETLIQAHKKCPQE